MPLAPTELPQPSTGLTVHAGSPSYADRALRIAAELGLPYEQGPCGDPAEGKQAPDKMALVVDEKGLSLTKGRMSLRGDFTRMANRLKQGNLNRELLIRAAKLKSGNAHPTAIDATAGLGEDALLLASAGYNVSLYERNPVIAALLEDAMLRAAIHPTLAGPLSRMRLFKQDSVQALRAIDEKPDIVLLDPMFPAKHKDASAKKKLQMLQQLEDPCEDEQELLEAAMDAARRKVIVKRPAKGPHLAGHVPDYTLAGKAIRYDCIVIG